VRLHLLAAGFAQAGLFSGDDDVVLTNGALTLEALGGFGLDRHQRIAGDGLGKVDNYGHRRLLKKVASC
jgi:hypothetical protein